MKLFEIAKKHEAFLAGEFQVYFTPGRVNLIGEHIDYQGGRVFPISISLGTYAFVSKRKDLEFHLISENFPDFGKSVIILNNLDFDQKDNWVNYPKGILRKFMDSGFKMKHGLNIVIYGDLPKSSGLSSSASIEVLIGYVLKREFNFDIDLLEIVHYAQYVENSYMNIMSGIMDQFTVAMAKANHGIYLDTNTLDYEYIPFKLDEYSIVVANTNKPRNLVNSKYNERVLECQSGLDIINNEYRKVDFLCNLGVEDFSKFHTLLTNNIVLKRVQHVIFENQRTIQAVDALKKGNLLLFGQLLNESHDSLRDLYEVSCKELDILVSAFRKFGSIGSRMTGAGFGGCTVSLVKTDKIPEIISKVEEHYINEIGYSPSFYIVEPSGGPRRLEREELLWTF